MNLAEIGQLVHVRRQALGLSQARLAMLSGLSRATINQLETGSLVDLGASKLIALLDLVGINLDAGRRPGHTDALQLASQSACCGALMMLVRALIVLVSLGKVSLVPDPRSAACCL